jgi:16S rRNA (adenine1518-N6/adenine1519-N6)-dimethyltransferase
VKRLAAAYAPQAFERLKVINEDILTFNVPEWLRQNPGAAVVGNIPYQISSPLVLQTLKFLSLSKGAIFLTQLEFARRLASASGSKEYGSISVYAQLRADVKLLATVERELFSPVPNVDSAIVAMEPLKETLSDADLARVEKVCRISFSQRRKQLANSLKPFLKDRNRDASPVDLSLRPEVLSPDKFYELSRFVFPTE